MGRSKERVGNHFLNPRKGVGHAIFHCATLGNPINFCFSAIVRGVAKGGGPGVPVTPPL